MPDLQYVSINPSLHLVRVARPTVKQVPINTNHVWLIDRSGSMEGEIRGLVADLKSLVLTLKVGDTVTLGWFSGYNQRNFIIKGFKIAGDADYTTLNKMLDKHASTVGMTCFSEILEDTKQVVEDLNVYSDVFSLIFFSDGYPTVGGNREVEKILETLSDLRGSFTTALLVGYGNYYNKALLAGMSETLGASLTHADDLESFRASADRFLGDIGAAGRKVKVEVPEVPYAPNSTRYQAAFSIGSSGTVNILTQDSGNAVLLPEGDEAFYILSAVDPKGARPVTLDKIAIDKGVHEKLVQGIYGAAYVLSVTAKTDLAMEALASIGDVALIDALTNAYTPTEYGAAEQKLLAAIVVKGARYKRGYREKYLPRVDAYCLLDALDALQADPQAKFYPYNDGFEYKRIGVKAEASDPNAPKFYANPACGTPISSLVWNSSMLNLSVHAKIEGKIKLVGNAKKVGFSGEYPTWIHRNYTLVKDGFLNVKALPVSMSENTFEELQDEGLIDVGEFYFDENSIHLVHLDRVPVINRKMAEGRTSAAALAELVKREYQLKGKLKALKWFKEQEVGEETEKVGVFASLSDEQVAFLEQNYIGKNGFAPKVEKAEPTDYYLAKAFDIKVKGLSSFPKVNDVIDKHKAGKKLTLADSFVYAGIETYQQSGMQKHSREVRIAYLNGEIDKAIAEQRNVSRQIQETKFSVIIAKAWFSEFSSRENCVYDHYGLQMTFGVSEVKVDI